MNKTMLCMELLQLLSTHDVMSKNELADALEINPRNIIEYIRTLQDCGYDIVSKKGVYGGYHLNRDCLFPVLNVTREEMNVLQASCSYLEKQADFLEYPIYLKAMSKVLSSHTSIEESNELTILDRFPLLMSKEDLYQRYHCFQKAMQHHQKCEVDYLSSHNKVKTHLIHPYKVFVYNGSWFVLAWNESVYNFGYFKLNRIQAIRIIDESYTLLKTYKESDFIDEFGMKQNGDYYHIKLEMTDLYTVISERLYGKNQRITKIDDHLTLFECDMQNKQMILSFVMGFGKKIKVIEPIWLKEMLIEEAKKIIEKQEM